MARATRARSAIFRDWPMLRLESTPRIVMTAMTSTSVKLGRHRSLAGRIVVRWGPIGSRAGQAERVRKEVRTARGSCLDETAGMQHGIASHDSTARGEDPPVARAQ